MEEGLGVLASDDEEQVNDSDDELGRSGSDDEAETPTPSGVGTDANKNFTDVSDSLEQKESMNRGWKPELKFTVTNAGPLGFGIGGEEDEVAIFRRLMGGDPYFQDQQAYTNLYAKQHKRSRWKDAELDELDALVGVLLFMGSFPRSRWGDDYIKRIFSFRRFTDLMSCLHFLDNHAVSAQSRRADIYWQMHPVISRINTASEAVYAPEHYCCVDEKRSGEMNSPICSIVFVCVIYLFLYIRLPDALYVPACALYGGLHSRVDPWAKTTTRTSQSNGAIQIM
jgi:hypothetical protein